MNEYRICSNCVMDTTDSKIKFDDKGVCDHCNSFYENIKPHWDTGDKGWDSLMKQVQKIKKAGKGNDFDCIMGMSGGLDSSYLTYVAKKILGLRPLVFHVDAGWNSQKAVNNIENLVDKLGLDLYTHVVDWEEMKDLQLSFFRASVPHIDAPQDHVFFATMYNFASKYGIRHILTGANYSTECVKNPLEWHYHATDIRQLKDIHNKFGNKRLENFPLTNILKHKAYYRYIKGIKVHKPLNYVPYIKDEAVDLLVKNYEWQKYPQKHFESRFTKFYEGYWLPEKFGYDKRKVQFSSLILTGQLTRDEALEKLKELPYNPDSINNDFEFVATKLGITKDDLRAYFDLPNKSYKDYKNQLGLFRLGTHVLQFLGIENRNIR